MQPRTFIAGELLCALLIAVSGCGSQNPPPSSTPTTAKKPVVEVQPAGLQQPVSINPSTSTPAISDGTNPPAQNGPRNEAVRAYIERGTVGPLSWPPIGEWGMKETAADALSRIGADAVPDLIVALRNPEVQIRLQAARALARIGPDAAPAVPALTAALSDSDPIVRRNAARALGQIGPAAKSAVPELIRALGTDGK